MFVRETAQPKRTCEPKDGTCAVVERRAHNDRPVVLHRSSAACLWPWSIAS